MSLRSTITRSVFALSMAAGLPLLAQAAPLKVDTAKSQVAITFKQMNVPVDATFKKFSAAIDFNAAAVTSSKASFDLDVASFDLGDAQYNKEVQKKEWFNAPQFPKANFISTGMKQAAGGKLEVSGNLTIKGKTTAVSFPVTLKKEGNSQIFEGTLPIKRLTYNIGEGEWKDTSMVADEVVIRFRIVTNP